MKKITLLFFAFVATCCWAQNEQQAKQILLSSVTNLQKSPTKATFDMTFVSQQTGEKMSQKGILTFFGKKFSLEMDDLHTFYDGKTQWVYAKAVDEVTISEPTEAELREINPLLMVGDCSRTHRIVFEKQPNEDAKFWHIFLFPLDKNADYFRLKIQISKADKLPKLVEISQKNGDKIAFSVATYSRLENVGESTFRFDKSKFPTAEINDLR